MALRGRGLLVLGASGSGKSSLALALIARGARLVSDDMVIARPGPDGPVIAAPEGAPPLVEARGLGLLPAPPAGPVRPVAAALMDEAETERLPPERRYMLLGTPLRAFHNTGRTSFADALLVYLMGAGAPEGPARGARDDSDPAAGPAGT